MANQPYFSQPFNNNTQHTHQTTEQILHIRAVDCINIQSDEHDDFNMDLEDNIEFTVNFSDGHLNRTNVLSLSTVYNKHGDKYIKSYKTNDSNPFNKSNSNNNVLNIPPYELVSKVELKAISFPFLNSFNIANVEGSDIANDDVDTKLITNNSHSFFGLDIPEFNGRIHSTNNNLHDIFAIIYYDSTEHQPGFIKPIRGSDFETKIYKPVTPINRLNKFTVKFLNSNGEQIKLKDISDDSSSDEIHLRESIKVLYQISLLFEFTIKL